MENKSYIIAEIGCNHAGSVNNAKTMVKLAKAANVDAVKFQTFNASKLISKDAPLCEYQKSSTTLSQLEMTKRLELKKEDYLMLRDYAESLGLEVFSTPFDIESIDFLAANNQNIWKIPSGEITNLPYLRHLASSANISDTIIISTGMSDLEEIDFALDIFKNFKNIFILHCTTQYPTPLEDVNLAVLKTLKDRYKNHKIGLSDHSLGTIAAIGAVAMGAQMIEKHFTLSRHLEGPDHCASMEFSELKSMVEDIRSLEIAIGSGDKTANKSEIGNKKIARRSIVANAAIKKGEVFTTSNITTKRPATGISPIHFDEILGLKSQNDFAIDEIIIDERFSAQE